jgi:hypothetical protein
MPQSWRVLAREQHVSRLNRIGFRAARRFDDDVRPPIQIDVRWIALIARAENDFRSGARRKPLTLISIDRRAVRLRPYEQIPPAVAVEISRSVK